MSTSFWKISTCILGSLLILSGKAMAKHKYDGSTDRIFQATVDTPAVTVSQNSKYLMPGQEIEITVLACQGRDRIRRITVNGYDISLNNNGTAVTRLMGGFLGLHTIDIVVTFIDSDERPHEKTYTIEYEVGQANANIAAGAMSSLYVGIDNPVYIHASGANSQQVAATIRGEGLTIFKAGDGKFIVRASKVVDTCVIYVSVDRKMAGASMLRVINVPDPDATVGNYRSGSRMSANEFSRHTGIKVEVAKNFQFKVDYKITGFTIRIIEPTGSVSFTNAGSQFPEEVKKQLSQLKPGSTILIDDITVEESTVRKIKLAPLVYYIN